MEISISERLEYIRALTRSVRADFEHLSDSPGGRKPELIGMINAILDRIMQIEYEFLKVSRSTKEA